MPAEATRLGRRITGRDRWFLAALVAAALAGAPVAFLAGAGDPPPRAGPGCVSVTGASIMGAATTVYCGDDATAACRRLAPTAAAVAAQCDRLSRPARR